MKILYAIQGTGNGHLTRAAEFYPHLKKYGEVDFMLSGSNCSLQHEIPVKYRSRGLSLFYNSAGSLNFNEIRKNIYLREILRDAENLPVADYDLVINDFDFITSLACQFKRKKSIHLGHQASFAYQGVPLPDKTSMLGTLILKHFARATQHLGIHFLRYHKNITGPVLRSAMRNAEPRNLGHLTIYLPQYAVKTLLNELGYLSPVPVEIFTNEVSAPMATGNISILPANGAAFSKSLINAEGVITAGGFETPAEALHLGKKLLCIPIKGQFEQACNAEALKRMGVTILNQWPTDCGATLTQWLNMDGKQLQKPQVEHTEDVVARIFEVAAQLDA